MSGWSWRSKETYGDKSAKGEGGEAEQPAADATSTPKTIWDAGGSDKSWWSEPEDGTTKPITGFSTGSSSYRAYSYDDAFDDSDSRWYRQNSFRYSAYRDYSPSRLFRNSFSGFRSNYQSADNELKNKAIQALRTLTRNANTVADKSAKITYGVKFGNNAVSNGSSDALATKTGKQQEQTIYVSPDDIANAKTDDDHDAAIDALTGFVLLRVQISQGVDKRVLDAVNATAMTALPVKLAGLLTTETVTKERAASAAEEYANDYAAGMLAKSLLTRLARRTVVKDWGGFAPYFVRHAKQFAAVREKLENKDGTVSVELLAAQIAYNFLIDDEQLPIDKPIEDIVTKHLGDELAAADILPACRKLIDDIRAHLRSEGKPEAGQIENALNDILESLGSGDASSEADAKRDIENHLDAVGDFLDDLMTQAGNDESTAAQKELTDRAQQLNNATAELKCAEKLAETINALAAALDNSTHYDNVAGMLNSAEYQRSMIESQLAHYAMRCPKIAKDPGITAEISADKNPLDATSIDALKESIRKQIENMKAWGTQMTAATKAAAKDLRNQVTTELQHAKEQAQKAAELIRQAGEKAKELAEQAQQLAVKHPQANTLNDAMAEARETISAMRAEMESHAAAMAERENAKRTRSMQSITSKVSAAAMVEREAAAAARNLAWRIASCSSEPTRACLSHGLGAYSTAKSNADISGIPFQINKAWHEPGKAAFFAEEAATQIDFAQALLNSAHKDLLQQLLKHLTASKRPSGDDDEERGNAELPSVLRKLAPEQREMLENAAANLGLSAQKLFEMLKNLGRTKTGNAKADALGEQIREMLIDPAAKISPVDEQLFGERVKNTINLLTGTALDSIHDEATHSVEEEFVAYLSHNDAKPVIKVMKQSANIAQARQLARAIKKTNRGAIERVRDALNFQSDKRVGEVHGLLSGDLDEGSLHKLRYDSEHIWSQKTLTRLPDVAVGILVDQSGSMGCGSKIEQAREMCIVLAEAVKQVPGVHLHIYGHTANRGGSGGDLQLFEHYSSTGDSRSADLGQLGAITAMSNNYDGYAIKETAKRLSLDPAKKKYLFIIADGLPHGTGYSGKEAEKHVKSVCTYVRTKLKISTYAFGVGVNHPSEVAQFTSQYGENNTVFISNVKQALPKIVRFLRHVLQKEKTLVDASMD